MTSKKQTVNLDDLLKKLYQIEERLLSASEKILEISEEENLTIAAIGFKAGEAYSIVDKAHDEISDITSELDNIINP